jgi:hypothetical protein
MVGSGFPCPLFKTSVCLLRDEVCAPRFLLFPRFYHPTNLKARRLETTKYHSYFSQSKSSSVYTFFSLQSTLPRSYEIFTKGRTNVQKMFNHSTLSDLNGVSRQRPSKLVYGRLVKSLRIRSIQARCSNRSLERSVCHKALANMVNRRIPAFCVLRTPF